MKNNSRRYARRMSYLKAKRKQRIDKERSAGRWPAWYNNLHQYSKGKIHCSCGMCRCKTKILGQYNYSIKDLKRILEMEYEKKREAYF